MAKLTNTRWLFAPISYCLLATVQNFSFQDDVNSTEGAVISHLSVDGLRLQDIPPSERENRKHLPEVFLFHIFLEIYLISIIFRNLKSLSAHPSPIPMLTRQNRAAP